MQLKAFRSLWGGLAHHQAEGRYTYAQLINMIRDANYNGIETPVLWGMDLKDEFMGRLRDNNLEYIGMVFTDGPVAPGNQGYAGHSEIGKCNEKPSKHLDVFKEQVDELITNFGPIKINCHAGNDYWTMKEADEFFSGALQWLENVDTPVMFEGHRKRFLYSPWVARDFLPQFPELKFVADHSHWVNVAETNAQDPVLTKVIEDCAKQTYHTHCRVGFDHGPQVNDPAAPEWKSYVEGHEAWWDSIWRACEARGDQITTITTEHGPPNYQPALPYTRQPLADWWAVNSYVGDRQVARFNTGSWKHLKA